MLSEREVINTLNMIRNEWGKIVRDMGMSSATSIWTCAP